MGYSPPGSSAHGISQASILEWVAISFSRGSSLPGDQPVSPALQADRYFIVELPGKHQSLWRSQKIQNGRRSGAGSFSNPPVLWGVDWMIKCMADSDLPSVDWGCVFKYFQNASVIWLRMSSFSCVKLLDFYHNLQVSLCIFLFLLVDK